MNYVPFYPSFPFNRYVESIYYYSQKKSGVHRKTIIPDGKIDINIYLDEKPKYLIIGNQKFAVTTESTILGPHKKAIEFQFEDEIKLIGIRLFPTSVKKIFGSPAKDFANIPVSLSSMLKKPQPKFQIDIDEEIAICLHRVADWIISLIPLDNYNEPLLDFILKINSTKGLVPLNELCSFSYNDYKKLQRAFFEEIGIRPKRYLRMVRFEAVHNEIINAEKIDWQNLILKYGFHDQSHLIKEFKNFTSHTPTSFYAKMNIFV